MLNKNRKKIAATAIACAILMGTSAQAGFVDDWATQTTSTNSGYHAGGDRGYLTGGSFSARWPMGTDNLMTISKPSIKAGCGGIDMFLGGFSFLDVDKLVEKLQRILSAAPAAAFSIALKTLAPQVDATINQLEALIEKLNNLQIDDCKAAKALVSVPIDMADGFGLKSMDNAAKEAMTDFAVSSGISQDWDKNIKDLGSSIKTMFTTNQLKSPEVEAQTSAAVAGCPATLKAVMSAPSVMAYMGTLRAIPAEYVDSMKAYIGDISVTTETGQYRSKYARPCDGVTFDSLINGPSIKMSGNSVLTTSDMHCTQTADGGMQKKVGEAINASVLAMKNKGTISAEHTAIINSIPMSIKPSIQIGIMAGIDGIVANKLTNVAATALVYNFVSDMIALAYQLEHEYDMVMRNQSGTDANNCNAQMFGEISRDIEKFRKNLPIKADEARADFAKRSQEGASIDNLMAELGKFRQQVRANISRTFSASLATRMGY